MIQSHRDRPSGRATRTLRPAALIVATVLLLALEGRTLPARAQSGGAQSGHAYTLTMADNGTTLNLQVGDSVALTLDTSYNWSVTVSNLNVLHRPPVALVRGTQALYQAVEPGQDTITATGDPPCGQATPACGQPSVVFTANIVVTGPDGTMGTTRTLTPADNGSTVSLNVGDEIALNFTPLLVGKVTISDPSVLQPVPQLSGMPIFEAVAPGQTTLTTSANPACYPQCQIASQLFTVTVIVGSPPGPPGPNATATYQPGRNILGAPNGTILPFDAYSWDPMAGQYRVVQAGTRLKPGRGYWAYFTAATTVQLSAAAATSTLQAPSGAWVLVGDPNPTQPATVSGADAMYTWNPSTGQYTGTTTLQPGQGAWAYSAQGGTITIAPQ